MRRFRPKFSIRTLAIFVTLVCAYFGAWEATKKYATYDHKAYAQTGRVVALSPDGGVRCPDGEITYIVYGIRTPAPFLLIQAELVNDGRDPSMSINWEQRLLHLVFRSEDQIIRVGAVRPMELEIAEELFLALYVQCPPPVPNGAVGQLFFQN